MKSEPGDRPEYSRVRSIFEEAIELPQTERTGFLDEACGRSTELRAEVLELLRYHEESAEFLDEPAVVTLDRMDGLEADASLSGLCIGQYRVMHLLDRGGMGAVYEAEQDSPRRRVALKILRRDLASPTWLRRFELEGQILARLRHPAITQIYEAGVASDELGDLPYFAMELVDGVSLLEWVRRESPTVRQRIELFLEVCGAIEHAHQQGVIHRDIKPQNVLVASNGTPKVLDFGVSRSESDESDQTATGQIVGTLAYMSPEQVLGRAEDIDTRSDIYALGAVLFELLSGERPHKFESESLPAMAATIREREPRRLVNVQPGLRGDLDTILEKCLERDKSRRYTTVSEFAADLRRYLEGRAIQARPPSFAYQLQKTVARHKLPSVFLLFLVALLVAYVVSTTIQAERERNLASMERSSRLDAEASSTAARSQASRAEFYGYQGKIASAHAALQFGQADTAASHLDAAPVHLRHFEWEYLRAATDQSLSPVDERLGPLWGLSYSPDGKRLALATANGRIRIREVRSRRLVTEFRHRGGGGVYNLEFHPDGRRLLVSARGVSVFDLETGKEIAHYDPKSDFSKARFGPLGNLVALAGARGRLWLWDWQAGKMRWVVRVGKGPLHDADIAATGGYVSSMSADRRLRLHKVEDGSVVGEKLVFRKAFRFKMVAVFGPRGEWIAVGSDSGLIRILSVPNLDPVTELRGHESRILSLAFSHDRRWMASASTDHTMRIWDLKTSTQWRRLRGFGDKITEIAIHPDNATLATRGSGGDALIWDPEFAEDSLILNPSFEVGSVALNDDASLVAAGGYGRSVEVWDALSGEKRWAFAHEGARASQLCFDHRGRFLIGATEEPVVRAWDLMTGEGRQVFWVDGLATSLTQHLHSDLLAIGTSRGDVTLFDMETEEVRFEYCSEQSRSLRGVIFHPFDPVIAIGANTGPVVLVNYSTGEEVFRLPAGSRSLGSTGGECLAFSPSGNLLATFHEDRVRLWHYPSGDSAGELRGHKGHVFSGAFSPDGERLATGSQDGSMKLWDVKSRECVLTLDQQGSWVYAVRFSRDGRRLATGTTSGTLEVFDAVPVSKRAVLRRQVRDNQRQLRPIVEPLIRKYLLRDIVTEALEETLDRSDSKWVHAARWVNASAPPSSGEIVEAARALIIPQDAPDIEVDRALRMNLRALRDAKQRVTEGMGHFRLGDFDGAVSRLTGTKDPAGLAFLSMAHARLGEVSTASRVLASAELRLLASLGRGNDQAKTAIAEARRVLSELRR